MAIVPTSSTWDFMMLLCASGDTLDQVTIGTLDPMDFHITPTEHAWLSAFAAPESIAEVRIEGYACQRAAEAVMRTPTPISRIVVDCVNQGPVPGGVLDSIMRVREDATLKWIVRANDAPYEKAVWGYPKVEIDVQGLPFVLDDELHERLYAWVRTGGVRDTLRIFLNGEETADSLAFERRLRVRMGDAARGRRADLAPIRVLIGDPAAPEILAPMQGMQLAQTAATQATGRTDFDFSNAVLRQGVAPFLYPERRT